MVKTCIEKRESILYYIMSHLFTISLDLSFVFCVHAFNLNESN